MKKFNLAGYIMPAFLVLITLFLVFRNYSSGTILLGWDSLHPEFNFPEAFRRIFSGVWREEQGVGAIAGHAHMVEIARLFFIGVASLVFRPEVLRWLYILLCLVLGPLGVYYFLSYVFRREKEGYQVSLAAFLGAAFYLLNLGTLQHFFVPFEMFQSQFAALPWIFLFVLKVLREEKRKNLLILAVLSFVSSGTAYAPALFYAYLGALGLFLLVYWGLSKFKVKTLKKAFVIVFLFLATNAFWILPNFYTIKNQSGIISEARINRLFSPEAFLRNVDSGNIKDVFLQKNFLFDWRVYNVESKSFTDLMDVWKRHLSDRRILLLGYSLSGIAVLGALGSLLKRDKVGMGLLFVSFLSLFFLINVNYQTGSIYQYLYQNIDVFKEGFRMPFTKFSILFEFSLSFFFACFFFKLFSKKIAFSAGILVFIGLVVFMLPAFRGNLISKVVQNELPGEYPELFSWFKGRDGRIVKLPIFTHWGWEYHDWGYEGSGFLTYGLSNPLLDRDFDRWSAYNESFYNEASRALFTENFEVFEKVLQKYQVKYLLLDESVINAGGGSEILFIPQIKQLVSVSGNIQEAAKFGFLTIYETNFGGEIVSTPKTYGRFDTDSKYSEDDTVFYSYGNYINDSEGATFPFVNFDKRMGVTVEGLAGRILVKSPELQFRSAKDLVYPEISFGEKEESPRVIINEEKKVQVSLPIDQKTSANLRSEEQNLRFQNCDLKKIGGVERQILGGKVVHLAKNGGVACEFFDFPELSHQEGYLLHIKGENKEGRSLKFYLQNWLTNRIDLEELLPEGAFDEYFFVLPKFEAKAEGPRGYSLNLETRSFGRIAAENEIETIEFIPAPIEWLREIRLEPQGGQTVFENGLRVNEVEKTGTWLYKVRTQGEGLLVLGQGYEKGWISFPAGDFKNKLEHVKVNSWANGWFVTSGEGAIYIIFWPQLLEYLGLALIPIGLIIALKARK